MARPSWIRDRDGIPCGYSNSGCHGGCIPCGALGLCSRCEASEYIHKLEFTLFEMHEEVSDLIEELETYYED